MSSFWPSPGWTGGRRREATLILFANGRSWTFYNIGWRIQKLFLLALDDVIIFIKGSPFSCAVFKQASTEFLWPA